MFNSSPSESTHDQSAYSSRFTYRDLRLLGQSSVSSPLRTIALVDFDCFYAQCERVRLGLPEDQPLGVQQFLHVIAINYPARAAGLKKVVTAVEAKQKCPNIVLQHVPTWREGDTTWAYRDDALEFMDSDKSSLDYYRLQSRRAIQVVKNTLPTTLPQRIEKAGIDEVFIDLSAQVHAILLERYPELAQTDRVSLDSLLPRLPTEMLDWHDDKVVGTDEADEDSRVPDWDDVALNIGAEVIRDLRTTIHKQLGYTCSAGIARNKVVAKLAAGHHKPNGQTIVRSSCIDIFLSTYKFTKLRGMGGKLGNKTVKAFKTEMIRDLLDIPLKKMQSELGPESGAWVYRAIRGIEHSEVVSRTQIKSMASAKTFTPSIEGLEQAERWLRIFAADIMGRIDEEEGRRPRTIAVHHQINGRFGPTRSKQGQIPLGSKLDAGLLFKLARDILVDITHEGSAWPCLLLTISVADFFDTETTSHSLTSFWAPRSLPTQTAIVDKAAIEQNGEQMPITERSRKRTILSYQASSQSHSRSETSRALQRAGEPLSKKQCNIVSEEPDSDKNSGLAIEHTDGKYQCPTCSQLISPDDVLEHLDWHVALDLQNHGSQH